MSAHDLSAARVIDFLDRFVIAHGRGPTPVELAAEFHVSETAIRRDLRVLREQGSVTWLSHKPHTQAPF